MISLFLLFANSSLGNFVCNLVSICARFLCDQVSVLWTAPMIMGFEFRIRSTHDVIKWKHFPRYCPFVREIHRSPVNSPHKGQWREVLVFSLICAWINAWVNNREAGDLRRHRNHYDVTVMVFLVGIVGCLKCREPEHMGYGEKCNGDLVISML